MRAVQLRYGPMLQQSRRWAGTQRPIGRETLGLGMATVLVQHVTIGFHPDRSGVRMVRARRRELVALARRIIEVHLRKLRPIARIDLKWRDERRGQEVTR